MSSKEYELTDVKVEGEKETDLERLKRDGSPDSGMENSAYIQSTETLEPVEVDGVPAPVAKKDKDSFESDSDMSDDENIGCCAAAASGATNAISSWYKENSSLVGYVGGAILLALWVAYFIGAMYYNFQYGFDSSNESAIRLIAINVLAVFCVIYWAIKKYCGRQIWKGCLKPCVSVISTFCNKHWNILQWVIGFILLAALVIVLAVDVGMNAPQNLVSLIGMAVYIGLFYIFSKHPAKVNWRPVILGLLLQFIFAYLILRTCVGYLVFKWMGDRMQEFLKHSDAGAIMVFGENYTDHFFAFKVLPVVIFFSTVIGMLYYLGVMQIVIQKVAWLMQVTMGTTAGESLSAAGNIFVGQTEAPLMIKPLLTDMTKSELHAVMTGGFATIAGSVLATYILFGVPANHLLSASVMSAPAALAMSKLFYPETKKSKTTTKEVAKMGKGPDINLVQAASSGASASIKLVANIAANLIAFLALLEFINQTLRWFGAQVGLKGPDRPELTFELICSYLLWPFAWIMGTPAVDCKRVAELIGIKTFANEFLAYERLSNLIKNRAIVQSWEATDNNTVLYNSIQNCFFLGNSTVSVVESECFPIISARGETIAVYALCGFANLGSIGIMLGGLGAMAPSRKKDIAAIVVRAMIAGNVACFMTACIAGLLSIPGALNPETCGTL